VLADQLWHTLLEKVRSNFFKANKLDLNFSNRSGVFALDAGNAITLLWYLGIVCAVSWRFWLVLRYLYPDLLDLSLDRRNRRHCFEIKINIGIHCSSYFYLRHVCRYVFLS
jgi:hypothetical protein